jgi:hypothetical protein
VTSYLVVHDLGKVSGVSIEPAGRSYDHPIECWAIDNGERAEYARLRLRTGLKPYYMFGRFDQMATYALDFTELRMIVSDHMGPTDRERYEDLVTSRNMRYIPNKSVGVIANVGTRFIGVTFQILWRALRFMLVMIAAVLLLGHYGRNRK